MAVSSNGYVTMGTPPCWSCVYIEINLGEVVDATHAQIEAAIKKASVTLAPNNVPASETPGAFPGAIYVPGRSKFSYYPKYRSPNAQATLYVAREHISPEYATKLPKHLRPVEGKGYPLVP